MKTLGKIITVGFFALGALIFIGNDNLMAVICAALAVFLLLI